MGKRNSTNYPGSSLSAGKTMSKNIKKAGNWALDALGLPHSKGGDGSQYVKHRLVQLVRDARDAGIHPLYALGAGADYSPLLQASDPSGGAQGLLARFSSTEQAAKADSGELSPLEQMQMEMFRASGVRDLSAAALSDSERALNVQKLGAMGRDRIGAALDQAMEYQPEIFGKKLPNAMIQVRLPSGDVAWIPDQNLMETGELLGAGATAYGAKLSTDGWWDSLRRRWAKPRAKRPSARSLPRDNWGPFLPKIKR